jgi:hypothetical protein
MRVLSTTTDSELPAHMSLSKKGVSLEFPIEAHGWGGSGGGVGGIGDSVSGGSGGGVAVKPDAPHFEPSLDIGIDRTQEPCANTIASLRGGARNAVFVAPAARLRKLGVLGSTQTGGSV